MFSMYKMFETKGSVLVFLCLFLNLAQCKLPPGERLKAEKECVDEVEIDYNIVLEVKQTLKVSDDIKYKQFLNCFYEKQGFKTEDGRIKFHELKEVLTDGGYTSSQADKILHPCKAIDSLDRDELPVLILQCIFDHVFEIDIED